MAINFDDGLLSSVDESERPLVVGDSIHHPTFGSGTLMSGWEGHLEIEFQTGARIFKEHDNLRLIPTNTSNSWQLLSVSDADAWFTEKTRLRNVALDTIRQAFANDFITSDAIFKKMASEHLSHHDYDEEKISFVQDWAKRTFNAANDTTAKTPDADQARAIASVSDHVLVSARAGSGKTETIANRAVFLQMQCGVAPSEMMLLAFNRKAAEELAERVVSKLGGTALPHIMTFHALAYALVPGSKNLLRNDSDGGEQSQNQELQQVLMDVIEKPKFEEKIRRLMLAYFRADWEKIFEGGFNLSPDQMLEFRRNLASETIRGEFVKSYGEKVIANFLFEHDVPYMYEQNHWWGGQNYRPDFTLPKSGNMKKGIIIEYFGIQGDPDYDKQAAEKREYWKKKSNEWFLLELSPKDIAMGRIFFERLMADALMNADVHFKKLPEDEIWYRARHNSILRFTNVVHNFIGRCRKKWILPNELKTIITNQIYTSEIDKCFVEIAAEIYELYLSRLEAVDKEDFDGLMQKAVSTIADGKGIFSRGNVGGNLKSLRYLFIDEYQDFSELFHRMVEAIRQLNPNVKIFCVGDDWQAINRFAGADLKYFNDFASIFSPSNSLVIPTNRRSEKKIVSASNALMMNRGQPAVTAKNEDGKIKLVDLMNFRLTSREETQFHRALLTPAILRLAGKALSDGDSVTLLSVTNELTDPAGGRIPIERYLGFLKSRLPVPLRDGLSISTTHQFKGNESDVVIILDANNRRYPLIHPNWIFTQILGESIGAIVDESRRLFYVALTRARKQVFIITEEHRKSPFIDEILNTIRIPDIDWSLYPPLDADGNWLTIKIGGDYEYVSPLIDGLKADSFKYRDLSRVGGHKSWDKSYRISELDDTFLHSSPWIINAKEHTISKVAVNFFDGMEKLILKGVIQDGELLISTNGIYESFRMSSLKASMRPHTC